MSKVFIVIPAFNEEEKISKVIQNVKKEGFNKIIVIDDGSSDSTGKLAKKQGVIVLRNIINRGLGCALNTGIEAAYILGADIIVTCDADGQHDPKEIKRLIKPILDKEADVVIGARIFNKKDTPTTRIIINKASNILTYFLFGTHSNDTQSGFRAFSRKSAELINIQTSRMEVSSEIIHEIGKNNLKLVEIPIKSIYTEYSLKKGQKLSNTFSILDKLLLKKILD